MAHENGGHLYRKLGEKIDSLQTRAPWNETFFELLKTLYAEEEAEVVIKMPFGLASLETIEKATGFENAHLRKILDNLCTHGLVIDLFLQGEYRYMPAPMVVGIFELVMMRTGDGNEFETVWGALSPVHARG